MMRQFVPFGLVLAGAKSLTGRPCSGPAPPVRCMALLDLWERLLMQGMIDIVAVHDNRAIYFPLIFTLWQLLVMRLTLISMLTPFGPLF